MKKVTVLTLTGLIIATAVCSPAIAQTTTPESNADESTIPAETGSASDLVISPRIGVGHTSSSGGFDGVTSFQGFIPLDQTPGHDLLFLEPRFLLDNDGNVGGSLLLGYRNYDQDSDRIFGGYVGLDTRETDQSSFYQLGLGLESLGRVWDFRINGYIPIGDTNELIDETRIDTGFALSTGFQDNYLMLSSRREQRLTRIYEAALFGLDAEVGAKLAEWDEGDLRAFAGLYFYDAAGIDSTLGWRLRLEARPTQNINLGVALQDDDIFGTNIVFSAGLTWPRVRPRGPLTEEQEVVARLGEPLVRNPGIAVDTYEESETIVEETTEPLMNPEEEAPYRFVHVTLGQQGGDGTFENPFGTVQEALNATVSDGNNIVYVDAGNHAVIPALTIPDRVRVLSQGPEQLLAGMPFPGFPELPARLPFSPVTNFDDGILVRLPFSADGNFPLIQDSAATNLVRMGDRTVLSGFRIANANGNGVFANSVTDVEIRDNTITNAGERGIFLNNVTGSVVLFDNTILGSQGGSSSGQGIFIQNTTTGAVEASIQRQELENNRVGIEIVASGDLTQNLDPQQIVDIDETSIRNSREQGLAIAADSLGNQVIAFRNGEITDNGAEGLRVVATNVGSQEMTMEDSTISSNNDDGIRVQAGTLDGTSTAAQEVFIRRNQITNNGGDGISIESNEVAAQEFAIDDNQITGNGGAGIRGVANNVSFQEYVTDASNDSLGISNNIISGNGDQGITLDANDSATLVADLQSNRLSDNETAGDPDLEVAANANTTDVCVFLVNNSSPAGIRLDNNQLGTPGFFEVVNLNSVSVRNTGTVALLPNTAAFTNRAGSTSCFED